MANLFSQNLQNVGRMVAGLGSLRGYGTLNLFGQTPQGIGAAISGRSQPYAMGSSLPGYYAAPTSQQVLENAATQRQRYMPATLDSISPITSIINPINNIPSPNGAIPPAPGIPGAPGLPDFEAQLNAAAGGAYSALNTQEQALRGQQPLTEADITQMGVSQSTPFTQAQKTGQAGYTQQESQTQQAQQNAIQQARQLFNELSQYNQSRFGSGSSAGPAAMELLSRSTQQQFGNIGNIAQQNIQQINNARQQLDTYTNEKIASINQNVQLEIAKSRKWFQDQLNQINTSRDTIESDKAAQRYQALRDRESYAQAIQGKALDYQMQLNNWRIAQHEGLTDELSQFQQTMPTVNPSNVQNQANQYQYSVPRPAGAQIPGQASIPSFSTFAQTQRGVRRLADGTLVDENGNPVNNYSWQ